ncbi:DUF3152 domain-containing protein [Jiangella anatolica]|uniref:DUF3152 domain-containing protein n=1 Tax=Jiangella anatolica TaxID=2670374 RepID=UPI001314957A|nr:DUF3152 domain-containing protein [Jiangella anatolica]
MASRTRRAGHPDRERRRTRGAADRRRRLTGFLLVLTTIGVVGWAALPDGEPAAGNAVTPLGAPTTQRPPKTFAVLPVERPSPAPESPAEPPAPEIAATGPGTFAVTPGQSGQAGTDGSLLTYTVEVEDGLPFDPIEVAAVVDTTLADPRSWIAEGEHSFQRVPSGGDLRILVATPGTTDELCAPLRTRGEVSCRNGDNVVLNALRWANAVPHYNGDVAAYRQYVVNHEVGHALGHGHVACPAPGAVAPVMLQQTYSLDGCVANSWPFP